MTRTGLLPWMVGGLVMVMASEPAFGLQRSVKTRIANYEEAAVSLVKASIQMTQTYSAPDQFPLSEIQGGQEVRINRSQVPYLNQLNQQVPTYALEGELEFKNNTEKEVVALQVTTVFLNAFRERVQTERQTLTASLRPDQTTRIPWGRNLPREDVFELYFVVTAARFGDGSVWSPTQEMILLP